MKVPTVILTKSKEVRRLTLNYDREVELDNALYLIDPSKTGTKIEKGRMKGPEIIFFEGHPIPVGQDDNSKDELKRIVHENLIENVADPPKKKGFNYWWLVVPLILVLGAFGAYQLYVAGFFNGILGIG